MFVFVNMINLGTLEITWYKCLCYHAMNDYCWLIYDMYMQITFVGRHRFSNHSLSFHFRASSNDGSVN